MKVTTPRQLFVAAMMLAGILAGGVGTAAAQRPIPKPSTSGCSTPASSTTDRRRRRDHGPALHADLRPSQRDGDQACGGRRE